MASYTTLPAAALLFLCCICLVPNSLASSGSLLITVSGQLRKENILSVWELSDRSGMAQGLPKDALELLTLKLDVYCDRDTPCNSMPNNWNETQLDMIQASPATYILSGEMNVEPKFVELLKEPWGMKEIFTNKFDNENGTIHVTFVYLLSSRLLSVASRYLATLDTKNSESKMDIFAPYTISFAVNKGTLWGSPQEVLLRLQSIQQSGNSFIQHVSASPVSTTNSRDFELEQADGSVLITTGGGDLTGGDIAAIVILSVFGCLLALIAFVGIAYVVATGGASSSSSGGNAPRTTTISPFMEN